MLAVVLISKYAPKRRLLVGIGAAAVVIVIGASRLYLGVHWLTDVLGGYALGLAWLSLVIVTSLLLTDPESYLTNDPSWRPTLPSHEPGTFKIRDLVIPAR